VTGTPNKDSIVQIGAKSLVVGTKVPYGAFHQSNRPRTRLPQRKFLFIGPEAGRSAPSEITGRLSRWMQIIDEGVKARLGDL
jgi:phage gpG-like protein